jgi:predicted Holliday junction resolvase-like endonuclease
MLSRQQRNKDLQEAVAARRAAGAKLKEALPIIEEAIRKLAYNKSDSIIFELKQIASDIKENASVLNDPEYDPD